MIIDYIENVLDDTFNGILLEVLKTCQYWTISNDYNPPEELKQDFINDFDSSKFSDAGLTFLSMNNNSTGKSIEDAFDKSFYNNSAMYIYNAVLYKSKFYYKNNNHNRTLWNYYSRSSNGTFHTDFRDNNYYSILYNIMDNDGGTIIGDKFYKSKSGSAIIFKSNVLHKGVGPKVYQNRFAVNLAFTSDGHYEKT